MKSHRPRRDNSTRDSEIRKHSAENANSDANQKPESQARSPITRRSFGAALVLLNVAEVSARLGVSEKTVRRWIEAKALPVHRLGRLVRVSESDLIVFISMSRDA